MKMGCSSCKPAVTKSNQPWQPQKAATEFRSRELTSVCKKVGMGLAIGTFYATALKCGRELWKSPASTLKANVVSRGRCAGDQLQGHCRVGARPTDWQETGG